MRRVVTQLPLMAQVDFIIAIEQFIAQQSPPEHRPHLKRLGWLRQVTTTD